MAAAKQRVETIHHRAPPGFELDLQTIEAFEAGLDPRFPEENSIPCCILGYGEITTVFEIKDDRLAGLALKRMSVFRSQEEMDHYAAIHREYLNLLEGEIGLRLPSHGELAMIDPRGRPIFYIIQKKLDPEGLGGNLLASLPDKGAASLFRRALRESAKVWKYNRAENSRSVAIDGQVSNWALEDFDPAAAPPYDGYRILYLDTSTPLFTVNGAEQLNPELFLRAAPSFLAWVLRVFFLEGVMTRYYDPRAAVVDMIANLYREQLARLIPGFIDTANDFFDNEASSLDLSPISKGEVQAYYREDRLIWTLYLEMRRFDQFLHRSVLRREYNYILPPRTKR